MTGFCEGSDEHLGSMKSGEFGDGRAVSFSKKKRLCCIAVCLLLC